MNLKVRLSIVSFLQFFVWGAWLTTIGTYCGSEGKGWDIKDFGAIFSTLAIASIFMPPIIGILADKYFNAEKIYSVLHIGYGVILIFVPEIDDPKTLFWVILSAMVFYMPSISLSYSLAYTILKKNGENVVKAFPPIRTFGTIGFIVAMWITNLTGNKAASGQFVIGAIGAVVLGVYALTLPACPPPKNIDTKAPVYEKLGFKAFKLFGEYKMAIFFLFALLLGAALQLTNMYADWFLTSFPKQTIVSKYSTLIVSISQMSETLFILSIPFFLKKFGIKNVMLFSMIAWFLRFGLFAYGDADSGFPLIILSCVVYGLAFDFFNVSGSLFVETTVDPSMRSSAQGIFMMMSNGIGAFLGSKISAWAIGSYFSDAAGNPEWKGAWTAFAIYALIVGLLFFFLFQHKHDPKEVENVAH